MVENKSQRTVFNRNILIHTLEHTNVMKDREDWQAVNDNIVLLYSKYTY